MAVGVLLRFWSSSGSDKRYSKTQNPSITYAQFMQRRIKVSAIAILPINRFGNDSIFTLHLVIEEAMDQTHHTNGVKQACILAPTLFTIFFSTMLQTAMGDLDEENGIYIRYHTNGSLFNLRRLKAHTKTLNHLVREVQKAQ
ncbi:hypothetical protein WISP_11086 [Willisornis vidua]|uniref:Reverse transcriptase domain-containing protein n=1 Tax=Willisornis vidua TaxID=1566151 RepID=A0ABQ9DRY4_9PASS|nr:hypothetical protein WISP_11086 [Willisornis vidua]